MEEGRGRQSHRDGVFGVARHVPAGIEAAVGEKCTGAWNVFFGPNGVDLVLGFVSFVGNRQQTNAVDGRVSRAEARNGKARMVPGDINSVGDEKEERERRRDTQN